MGNLSWVRGLRKPNSGLFATKLDRHLPVDESATIWITRSASAEIDAAIVPSQELESAVREPPEIEAHPPATAGSFPLAVCSQHPRLMALLVVLPLTLIGCSTTNPSSNEPEPANTAVAAQTTAAAEQLAAGPGTAAAESKTAGTGQNSANESAASKSADPANAAEQAPPSATPAPKPSEKPKNAGPVGGPGFESSQSGAPAVHRVDGKGKTETAQGASPTTEFGKSTGYPDGLGLEVAIQKRGKVSNTGPGYVTGAQYVVFTVSVDNQSSSAVDLNAVVLTLRTGKEQRIAAPLYGEVETFDFTGVLEPHRKSQADYAFLLPTSGLGKARLYVDIDSRHRAATIQGTLDAS